VSKSNEAKSSEAAVDGPISVQVFNRAGDSVSTIKVDPADFGGVINKQLLHDCVLMYRANQRAGTHSTLRRGEVAGSTKKVFRQKGTGNARIGNRRTNKRRGGGTAKGPKPRDYYYRLPAKALRIATRMAILSKLADNEVTVIDEFALSAPKTKEMAGILKALKLDGVSCLMCTDTEQQDIYKSGRNIRGVGVLPAAKLNAYEVLKRKRLLLTKAALESLRKKK
jgi:large subunit ribosomal protein L4